MPPTTTYLKTVLVLISLASRYLDFFMKENNIIKTQKHIVGSWSRKLTSILVESCKLTSPELAKAIEEEVIENWDDLAIQTVLSSMVNLSNDRRLKVEALALQLMQEQDLELKTLKENTNG